MDVFTSWWHTSERCSRGGPTGWYFLEGDWSREWAGTRSRSRHDVDHISGMSES